MVSKAPYSPVSKAAEGPRPLSNRTPLLDRARYPADLRRLEERDLRQVSDELRQELVDAFSLEGINRSNAVVNFKEDDPFDPKAAYFNAELIRTMPVPDLAERLLPFVRGAGYQVDIARMAQISPLIRERIKLLRDVLVVADFSLWKNCRRMTLPG